MVTAILEVDCHFLCLNHFSHALLLSFSFIWYFSRLILILGNYNPLYFPYVVVLLVDVQQIIEWTILYIAVCLLESRVTPYGEPLINIALNPFHGTVG